MEDEFGSDGPSVELRGLGGLLRGLKSGVVLAPTEVVRRYQRSVAQYQALTTGHNPSTAT